MPEGAPPPTHAPAPDRRRAWIRTAVTGALLALLWWPARPGAEDGFPLSSYPMFGYARSSRSVVRIVLGVSSDGRRVPLTPWHVGGTPRSKHALHTAQTAVLAGRSDALCVEVARRVAASPLPQPVVALEVVTDVWDTMASSRPDAEPSKRRVHARCDVP